MATWIITGANRGLGLEFVKQLLAAGHTVLAGVRRPESMEFEHEQMIVFQLDVASTTSVKEFAEHRRQRKRRIVVDCRRVNNRALRAVYYAGRV